MSNFLLILANIFLAVSGQIFIKQGVNKIGSFSEMQLGQFLLKSIESPLVIMGLILYFISAAIWVMVLSKVDLSFAYPMLSLGYILILFLSWAFLHETISPVRIAGVVLIIAGVYFVFRS